MELVIERPFWELGQCTATSLNYLAHRTTPIIWGDSSVHCMANYSSSGDKGGFLQVVDSNVSDCY